MYAWRARLGLVHPTHRGKAFAFWYKYAPDGVEIVPTFIGFRSGEKDTFDRAFARAEQLATELLEVGCQLISVSGTPPFLLRGRDFERQWRQALSDKLGLPVVVSMEAHALALRAMGARRVAVASYYGDELNRAIVEYLARYDIEALIMGGFSLTGQSEALYATPLLALDEVSYVQVYQYCRRGLQELGTSVDAIYINGAGWDAAPAVDYLERDLKTKVVYAMAAEMWLAYHHLSIANPVPDCGSLVREAYEPDLSLLA